VVATIARIGEPDAAGAIDHQIVGTVETATVEAVDQRRLQTVGAIPDDLSTCPLAGVE
jgi:hypothetical protein